MSKADFSENEDDPPVYESSGSEWNSESELEPVIFPLPSFSFFVIPLLSLQVRKTTRRTSSRVSKKPRLKSESSSESDYEEPKPRKRNGVNKKQKVNSDSSSTPEPTKTSTKTINSKDYSVSRGSQHKEGILSLCLLSDWVVFDFEKRCASRGS